MGKYFYHHCRHGCKERFKPEVANKQLVKRLTKVSSNTRVTCILKESLDNSLAVKQDQKAKLGTEIEKAKDHITNARRLMPDKEIEANEYRKIKEEYQVEIEKLEREIE